MGGHVDPLSSSHSITSLLYFDVSGAVGNITHGALWGCNVWPG
jgi:hypothetical protein